MNFREWQQLEPREAAREVHQRVRTRLAPAQQRAAIAALLPEPGLAEAFAAVAAKPAAAPLARVPYFAKDLFDAAGWPTLAGATFLPEVRPAPAADGAMIGAMREAGAVLAGKAQLHEFAYGITGENPNHGDVEHPHFPGRTTGGSSSGSAALVAADVVPLALGSDTGGSVRLPAAFCGLFGFRLTPREPWIADAFPLAPSFDTAGWFTRDAGDMRAAIAALIGLSPTERAPRGCYLEIGDLDSEVATACRAAAAQFTSPADATTRAELEEGFAPAFATYQTVVAREAWEVHRGWAGRYRERYDPNVWQRLMRVQALTATQIADAERGLATVRATWRRFFLAHDFLALPASPCAALTKAGCTIENRNRILVLTGPASVGGLPVLTIPVPLASGLTTGLQLVVNHVRSPVVSWALDGCKS